MTNRFAVTLADLDTQTLAVSVAPVDHVATGEVRILGHQAGNASASLMAVNTIADPDAQSNVVQFQWQHRMPDGTWSDIAGANSSMLTNRHGEVIRVASTYDDAAGHHSFASDETAFIGTTGANMMRGTDHYDVILGLDGNDMLLGMGGGDVIKGGGGRDRIYGGMDNDVALGGRDDDMIDGGDGNDGLAGNGGRDRLNGGNGDDTLNGGGGDDVLVVGSGNDTIVLARHFGNDVAFGFDSNPAGGQDHIDVRGLGIHTAAEFNHAVTIEQVGHDTLVTIGQDGTLKLIGVNAHTISISDFYVS